MSKDSQSFRHSGGLQPPLLCPSSSVPSIFLAYYPDREREVRVCRFEHKQQTGKSKLPCKRMITVRTHCSTCPWNTLQAFVNASCQRHFEILCISHGSVADTGVRWESYDVHLALRRTKDGIVTWPVDVGMKATAFPCVKQCQPGQREVQRSLKTKGRCQAKQCWSSVIVWLDAHAFINL